MKSKLATKAQRDRMENIKRLGCLICGDAPCHAHHLLIGGVRRGHDCTIGLCEWHHITRNDATGIDPSYHGAKRRFNALHGSDDELLARQDALLEEFA